MQNKNIPRAINILDFAEDRFNEIKFLDEALNQAPSSNTRAYQQLPTHLRRRSMSYSIKRLPIRLRKKAQFEIDQAPQKPPNRKKKRRRSSIRDLYGNRKTAKKQWLTTHLWHCKRFHMIERYGYKIANIPHEKSFRSSLLSSIHRCTLCDISYYECLQLFGNKINIISLLEPFLPPISSFSQPLILQGHQCYLVSLHLPNRYPYGNLCQVSLMWMDSGETNNNNSEESTLWIWIHPISSSLIYNLLSFHNHNNIIIKFRQDLDKFEIRGKYSHNVLNTVIKVVSQTPGDGSWLWSHINHLPSSSCLPSQLIIGLKKPQASQLTPSPHSHSSTIPPSSSHSINSLLLSVHNINNIYHKSSLWFYPQTDSSSDSLPLILISQSGDDHGLGSGYDIIIPSSYSLNFWLALTFKGAKPIGLRDRRRLFAEQQYALFPEDSLDTSQVMEHYHSLSQEQQKVFERKPKSKRLNYKKLQFSNPFFFDFSTFLTHHPSPDFQYGIESLQCLSFYIIRDNNILQQFSNLLTSIPKPSSSNMISSLRSQFSPNALINLNLSAYHKGSLQQYGTLSQPIGEDIEKWQQESFSCEQHTLNLQRKTCGFITFGFFSLLRGEGAGIGICSANMLLDSYELFFQYQLPFWLLYRNINSRSYHPIRLNILKYI